MVVAFIILIHLMMLCTYSVVLLAWLNCNRSVPLLLWIIREEYSDGGCLSC